MVPSALILALMLLQYPYPYPRTVQPRQRPQVNPQAQSTDAVATFVGTFKSADKKFLNIELDEGNSMRLYLTGSTRFVRDGKNVKASEFHGGEDVTVEASYDAHLNLLADRVIAGKPRKQGDQKKDDANSDNAKPLQTRPAN